MNLEDKWKQWCRLCGKDNEAEINIFLKEETNINISEAIQSFLSITISASDGLPQQICKECHQMIIDIADFSKKATEVQTILLNAQCNSITKSINLEILRKLVIHQKKSKLKRKTVQKNGINDVFTKEDNSLKQIKIKESFQVLNASDNVLKSKVISVEPHDINDNIKEEQRLEETPNRENPEDKKLPTESCEICHKNFLSFKGLKLHKQMKHGMHIEKNWYSCPECGKSFNCKRNLRVHEQIHLAQTDRLLHPCPHCDKKFVSLSYIQNHIRFVHEKELSFICEECGRGFATNDRLVDHKLVHSDSKPYVCEQCQKAFKSTKALKVHLVSHDSIKFTCNICGSELNTKKNLRIHMVVHSEERKFKCNFCEKTFKRIKEFKNHLILHTGLKPYSCPFCELTFANGSNCRKHQKHVHPVELAASDKAGIMNTPKNIPSLESLKAANDNAVQNPKIITQMYCE